MRNSKVFILPALLLLGSCFVAATIEASDDALKKSAVQIFTVIKRPNYYQPWEMGYQYNSGGSGFIVKGRRILTNAHVVSDQVYIQVKKAGDTKKYTAHVEHVAHDCEVAMLTVEDPAFFDGTIPVEFGPMPFQRDKVAAYGFPIGGNDLSITEGVVSRIEVQTYTHSRKDLLAIQTDAAINPGNSGGPVFKDGKLIGISFQSYSGSRVENTGYIVPVIIVERFLKDIGDGRHDGVPDLGIFWQKLESEALRKLYKLGPSQNGVLVTKVVYDSPAWNVLREGDILAAVDGIRIANDGTVPYRKSERLIFSHIVSQHQMGEEIALEIFRSGAPVKLAVKVKPFRSLVSGPYYDVRPTYFVFAGFVFLPLNFNYMDAWDWKDVDPRFKYFLEHVLPSENRRQVVLINEVLADDINIGYHKLKRAVVERINGVAIRDIRDVLDAVSKPQGDFHVIEIDHYSGSGGQSDYDGDAGTRVVVDAKATAKANEPILTRYRVPADRSDDLKP
ncbi:MAG: trypsin-like peptidase domain-containing protein [Elusimicrobia bacterium]|nr:trypsin-like peptidase domain-containing protein [Elusimicrobiota bacterium]